MKNTGFEVEEIIIAYIHFGFSDDSQFNIKYNFKLQFV